MPQSPNCGITLQNPGAIQLTSNDLQTDTSQNKDLQLEA